MMINTGRWIRLQLNPVHMEILYLTMLQACIQDKSQLMNRSMHKTSAHRGYSSSAITYYKSFHIRSRDIMEYETRHDSIKNMCDTLIVIVNLNGKNNLNQQTK